MWQLTGQRGEDKLDPGSRDSTIKRLAAFYSTPTVIEDNASSNKVLILIFKPEIFYLISTLYTIQSQILVVFVIMLGNILKKKVLALKVYFLLILGRDSCNFKL